MLQRRMVVAGLVALLVTASGSVQPAVAVKPSPPVVIEDDMEANFDFRATVQRKEEDGALAPTSLLIGYRPNAPYLALTLYNDTIKLAREQAGTSKPVAVVRQHYAPPRGADALPLVVQWRNGGLRVIYDGLTVLRQDGLGKLGGAVAVTDPEHGLEFDEARCQPVEPVNFADDFMRSGEEKGQWEPVTGNWKVHSAPDPSKVANAFTYLGQGKPAIAVAGRWFWSDYRAATAVRPTGQSEVGLVVDWQDARNYIIFRWLPEDGQSPSGDRARGKEKQLWRVWHGQPVLLAAAPGGYRAGQWYHLAVGAGGGLVSVAVDGRRALEKRTELFGQGKIGLYSSGDKEVMFDDVTVEDINSRDSLMATHCEAITPQFTKEQSMEDWASPKSEWLASGSGNDAVFWHRGTWFGDHALELKATNLEPNHAKVTATLCGDGESAASGYSLVATQAADRDQVQVVLLRQGKAVTAPRAVKIAPDAGCVLRLERSGRTIRAGVGKETVASYSDYNPLSGRRAAYAVQGAQVQFSDAHISGSNLYDYTFDRAPIDWFASGGTWDMTSRWDCTPTWSWYGGWSDRIAAIWNKHSFSGDYTVEVFAACKREGGVYRHPRDFNITVAGDGRDLASGYSFIFAGWDNTATRIMRGTRQVAETKQVLLPHDYQAQAHHSWFCMRIEKKGDTFYYYVNRKLALQYKDPHPLSGRRMALWTCGNGIIIARATVYYEQELDTEPVPPLVDNAQVRSVDAANLHWLVHGSDRGNDQALRLDAVEPVQPTTLAPTPAVRVVNLQGGGQFGIQPELEPFDALKTPKLAFDCQLAHGTAVNLYLKAKGVYHSVRLSGPAQAEETDGVKAISAATGVAADGLWHHVSLDLAALLKPLYPNDGEIRIEEVFLGNMARDSYEQAGFGANYPGTSYLVRAFQIAAADGRVAKLVGPELKAPGSGAGLAALAPPPSLQSVALPQASGTGAATNSRGLYGLRATFYQDPEGEAFRQELLNQPIKWKPFGTRVFTRAADTIDFDWQDKSPGHDMRATYWSARFTARLMVPQDGDYTFVLDRLDDGARLTIDGKPVLESWLIQSAAAHESKPIHLTAGAHSLRLDYCQGTGLGSLTLRWNGPGFGREVVPKATEPAGNALRRVAAGPR